MALPERIREAARKDIENLNDDTVGLQRAALEAVAENRCDIEQARHAAGQCRDAIELRAAFESDDE